MSKRLPDPADTEPSKVVHSMVRCFFLKRYLKEKGTSIDVWSWCRDRYMGRVPNLANAFMSAGHNCWGILWAPVSGKAMSELILDGKSSCVDLTAFDPARFAPRATGGRGRKRGNEPVGEQW